MRYTLRTTTFSMAMLAAQSLFGAGALTLPHVTVGGGLEVITNIPLDDAAPSGGLEITLTSTDPSRLMFSKTPEAVGSAVIKLIVAAGFRGSPDFCIQGFAKTGTVSYTASAAGFPTVSGAVTLAPSGIILSRSGMGVPSLLTTTGAGKTSLVVYSALLDSELNFLHPQPVAGGRPVKVTVTSSNANVGTIGPSTVLLAGGSASADIEFRPITGGETTLSVDVPEGFSAPAAFARVSATVVAPGMAVADEISIGQNLETGGTVSLGEAAPSSGVTVTLTSSDPSKLLLSAAPGQAGADCIKLKIPNAGVNAPYRLQALASSGTVTYKAEAPGFRTRTGTITLTPSGVVIGGPQGPPDEAELLVKEIAEGPHGFVASLSAPLPMIVSVYTVQLDPVTLRGADLTVQPLRTGVVLKVTLSNTNPAAGKVKSAELTIPSGSSSAVTHFVPAGVGTTIVSLTAPPGYTKASNSTSLTITVKE